MFTSDSDSVYERTIRSFSTNEAREIEDLLAKLIVLGDASLIIANLKREKNLPQECMASILRSLVINISDGSSREELKKEYNKICGKYPLKGNIIQNLRAEYFGNATFIEPLIKTILRANENDFSLGAFGDEEVRSYLMMLIKGNRSLREKDLDNFSLRPAERNWMWATWSDRDGGSPFDFMQTKDLTQVPPNLGSPYEVRLCLALECESLRSPTSNCGNMLLLTYEAAGIEARIPTIADAGYYKYFLPCSYSSDHGWTNPSHQDIQDYYTKCLQRDGYCSYSNKPRPEAVHRSITLGCLQRVEELRIPSVIV